jgi:pimeloyl-ACP methyl ester carboxylesterase
LLACIVVATSACVAERGGAKLTLGDGAGVSAPTVGEQPGSSTLPPVTIPPTTTSTRPEESTTTTTRPVLSPPTYDSVERYHWIRNWSSYTARGLSRWQSSITGIEHISISSTLDGVDQPALWLPPDGDGEKPVIVILHSWSSNYLQHAGIPYALWAQENGWAVIAPDFRGRNDDVYAIGSEFAVRDVVDAIDFATAQDGVDGTRVFAVGYSGGGMMGLLLAGRHPNKVSAVAAWGPVYDLVPFYRRSRATGRHYSWEIATACGGDPRLEGPAQEECIRRSPIAYIDGAREAGIPVYLGQGLWDSIVSPRQSANAFNQLADSGDRFTDEQVSQLGGWRIPADIGDPISTESFFGPGDPQVFLARKSAAVTIVYFRSSHDMVYQATMRWFASDPG